MARPSLVPQEADREANLFISCDITVVRRSNSGSPLPRVRPEA